MRTPTPYFPTALATAALLLLGACEEPLREDAAPTRTQALTAAPTAGYALERGEPRAITRDVLGITAGPTIRGVERDDPDYNAALRELAPGLLRFPGGTVANYWDWETGDFVCGRGGQYVLHGNGLRDCLLPSDYQNVSPPHHKLEHFKTELERTGARAVFVLNMITKRPDNDATIFEHAAAMLAHAEEIGIPVRYIELGNEFYLCDGTRDASPDNVLAFPTVEDYAALAQTWTRELRARFPEARIAVVGADRRFGEEERGLGCPEGELARRNTWNARLAAALDSVRPDAITLHPYGGAPAGEASVASVLGVPGHYTANFRRNARRDLPAEYALWLTEYGLFSRDAPIHGTWTHGLYVAAMTLDLLAEPRAEMMQLHSGADRAVFGTIFRDADGFDYKFAPTTASPPTIPWAKTAAGENFELIAKALRGTWRATPVRLPDGPTLRDDQPAVRGLLVEGNRKKVILVNLSDESVPVDLSDVYEGPFDAFGRAADPRTQLTGDRRLLDEDITRHRGSIELPPYSLTRLIDVE